MAPTREKQNPGADLEPAPGVLPVGLLLTCGVLFLVVSPLRHELLRLPPLLLLAVVALIAFAAALVPAIGRLAGKLLARVRHPSASNATRSAFAIGIAAGVYLLATAWWQATDLVPRLSDESSYLIQARMLAEAYLWHDPHPPEIRPFFDTLNLLVSPTYGSMYFPGTAMLYVPAILLDIPYWNVSLLLSAACAGLLYRLVVDLVDGVYAIVAVFLLLGLTMFRALSVMLLSQTPMLLMALVMLLAYVRWRRQFDWRWAVLIGAMAGWSGITRPADALCYAVAVGVAMLLDLRRGAAAKGAAASRIPLTLACLVLPALPFLALQAVQNVGMTGHWWEFPEARYADETYPAPMLGFHDYDLSTWKRPGTERIRLLSEFIETHFYAVHEPARVPQTWWELRLPETIRYGLAHPLLVVLLPIGFLSLRNRPRLVVTAAMLLFLAFYAFYVFYIPHYMVVIALPLALLVLLGARSLERAVGRAWPRIASAVALGLPLSVAAVSVGVLPEFHPDEKDHAMFPGTEPVYVEYLLEDLANQLGDRRALVLFRFDLRTHVRAGESLYTDDVAWVDDGQIVRAADLGEKNAVLFRYYAHEARQPDRMVYVYDAATGKLSSPIGTVLELSERRG